MARGDSERPIVWSSDGGRAQFCKRCGEPLEACRCGQQSGSSVPPRDGWVRLAREKAGRGGKVVTTVHGMPGNDADLAHLAQDLKRYCGAGGTVRNGIIELQGEHREKLRTYLIRLGYRVKVAGG